MYTSNIIRSVSEKTGLKFSPDVTVDEVISIMMANGLNAAEVMAEAMKTTLSYSAKDVHALIESGDSMKLAEYLLDHPGSITEIQRMVVVGQPGPTVVLKKKIEDTTEQVKELVEDIDSSASNNVKAPSPSKDPKTDEKILSILSTMPDNFFMRHAFERYKKEFNSLGYTSVRALGYRVSTLANNKSLGDKFVITRGKRVGYKNLSLDLTKAERLLLAGVRMWTVTPKVPISDGVRDTVGLNERTLWSVLDGVDGRRVIEIFRGNKSAMEEFDVTNPQDLHARLERAAGNVPGYDISQSYDPLRGAKLWHISSI